MSNWLLPVDVMNFVWKSSSNYRLAIQNACPTVNPGFEKSTILPSRKPLMTSPVRSKLMSNLNSKFEWMRNSPVTEQLVKQRYRTVSHASVTNVKQNFVSNLKINTIRRKRIGPSVWNWSSNLGKHQLERRLCPKSMLA